MMPDNCPVCNSADLFYFRVSPESRWLFLCYDCVPEREISAVTHYANEWQHHNPCVHVEPAPAPEPVEHSPLSEPLTVDDMLYETLGYYPATREATRW